MEGLAELPMELQLDAINLLLRDLGVTDHSLQHRAAFRGCTGELAELRAELMAYLRKRRETVRAARDG